MSSRLFGVKRRSRRLRHALEELAGASAIASGRTDRPADAAYHDGERAAYVAALARLAGTPAAAPASPPADPTLRDAWQRGHTAARGHADRLFDQVV